MLRGIVGQEAFRRGLTALQARFRFHKAGTDDLREALEAESGHPLSAYFDAWVFGTALPSLEVSRRHEPGGPPYRTHVSVRVQGLPGPVPLELGLPYPGGRETRTVELSPDGGAWTLETAGPPGKLEVNTNQGLLARISRK
jgi:aminopeptidase N